MGSILLVEPEPDTRERLGNALVVAGHEVVLAFTMREAFLKLTEGGIDVVVVDAYDPRVGVIELAKNIDNLPEVPPLVLVSGSPHAPEISARIGAALFLPKPCEPTELAAAVTKLIKDHRPMQTFDDEPTGPAQRFG